MPAYYVKEQYWVSVKNEAFFTYRVPVVHPEDIIAVTVDRRRPCPNDMEIEFDWSNMDRGVVNYYCKHAAMFDDCMSLIFIVKEEMTEGEANIWYRNTQVTPQIGVLNNAGCWPILWCQPDKLNPEPYGLYAGKYASGGTFGEAGIKTSWERNYGDERTNTEIHIPKVISPTEITEEIMSFADYMKGKLIEN